MSRRRLKARDKITQKISRDGLILKNESTGENQCISNRGAEFDLKSGLKDKTTYSQVGNRSIKKTNSQKRRTIQKNKSTNKLESKEVTKPSNEGFEKVSNLNINKVIEETLFSNVLQKPVLQNTSILIHDKKTMLQVEDSKVSINKIANKTIKKKLNFDDGATKSQTNLETQTFIDLPKTFS